MSEHKRLTASACATPRSKRWLALDVFRGLAVLSMVQGHTFTALLAPSAYEGAWSAWHKLLHGLTGPMFLLGGGVAYGMVTLPAHAPSSAPDRRGRLLRRALTLLLIGYALQVPRVPLSRLVAEHELLSLLLRVGPLQLVAVCLLLGEALRAVLRSRACTLAGFATLALVTALAAPWIWSAHGSDHAPLWIGMWLDGYAGSMFPFFPWATFFFVGVVLSPAVSAAHAGAHRHATLSIGLIGGGLAAAAFAYAMFLSGHWMRNIYGDHYELWHTSPLYVLFRAGLVVACLGTLSACGHWLERMFKAAPNLDAVFGVLSRQSLVAYVTHLLVLYGTPLTKGVAGFGTTLSMPITVAVTCAVLLFTTAIAVIWNHAVSNQRLSRSALQLARRLRDVSVRQVDRVGERERRHPVSPQQPIEP